MSDDLRIINPGRRGRSAKTRSKMRSSHARVVVQSMMILLAIDTFLGSMLRPNSPNTPII